MVLSDVLRYLAVTVVILLALLMGTPGGRALTYPGFDPQVTVTTTTTLGSGGTADWWGRSYVVRRPSDGARVMVYRRGVHHDSTTSTALHIRFNATGAPGDWSAEDTALASDGGGAISGFPLNPTGGNVSYGEGMPLVAPNGDIVILMWRVDGNSGSGTPKGTWQARSTDGGLTWTQEGQVTSWGGGLNSDRTFATDDWFTVDRVTYTAGRVYNAVPTTDSYVVFLKNATEDLAVGSWAYVSDITSAGSDTQEIGMEYFGNGRVFGLIRSLNNNITRKAISDDLGASWTVTDVTSIVEASGRHRIHTRARLLGQPAPERDPVGIISGFQLMNPGSSQSRRNALWFTPDRGDTIVGPFYLDSTTEDAGYGDTFAKADGTFATVSYQGSLTAASLKQYDWSVDLAP